MGQIVLPDVCGHATSEETMGNGFMKLFITVGSVGCRNIEEQFDDSQGGLDDPSSLTLQTSQTDAHLLKHSAFGRRRVSQAIGDREDFLETFYVSAKLR